MINRILIRIKVVQTLYSYMLTRSDFRIPSPPEKANRDSIRAYKTFIDTLLLIAKISGQRLSPLDTMNVEEGNDRRHKLSTSTVARAISGNSALREAALRTGRDLAQYAGVLQTLHDRVVDTEAFADYAKKRSREINDEVSFWTIIIETVLSRSKELEEIARSEDDFTVKGFKDGFEMAIQTLRDYSDVKSATIAARRSLEESLSQAYKLYHILLQLPVEITRLRAENIEAAKEKYLPTPDEKNPNMKLVNNLYVRSIEESEEMAAYFKDNPFSWENNYFLIRKLLDDIMATETYGKYMADTTRSYEKDCEFWRTIMKDVILPSDDLAEALESRSVYWNDDVVLVGTFVIKTMRRTAISESKTLQLMPMFKDEEDGAFGQKLLSDAMSNAKEYRDLVDRFIDQKQWDSERLALMDIVILTTAISELLNFPAIPAAVTLNEYIEIANFYSTARSGQFVNGILFSVINYLNAEGRLHKKLTDTRPETNNQADDLKPAE